MTDGLTSIYPRLWRFCLVLTKSRPAADDLAQATSERAISQADKFEIGTDLDRWLFTIARRIWLNDIRSAKVRSGRGLVSVEDTDLEDNSPPVETNIFAHQVLERIQALPEGQRLCVLLVYVEGYSYREAADMLGIPIGTVMSRLSTARRAISDHVGEERMEN
ncbi:RNA polymerase sigma factor [Phaeobacter sp. C3_T13_0]|uniref:RNA polymerase sigma factor n=1 Tax=Phaeobacter cretensis TaxID=3342641 RepID=UPI0039BD839B